MGAKRYVEPRAPFAGDGPFQKNPVGAGTEVDRDAGFDGKNLAEMHQRAPAPHHDRADGSKAQESGQPDHEGLLFPRPVNGGGGQAQKIEHPAFPGKAVGADSKNKKRGRNKEGPHEERTAADVRHAQLRGDRCPYDTIARELLRFVLHAMPPPHLTAVVLARDEADNLEALLPTLGFADRVLVVDGGSRDATAVVARRHGADVLVAEDWQGYGVQRRRAEEEIHDGWIFMVDADERVTPALAREIREAVASSPEPAVYTVPRTTWVFGRYLHHGGWYPDEVARLYTKGAAAYDARPVHERLLPGKGVPVRRLRTPLLHYSYRDLEHYLIKSARYAALSGAAKKSRGEHGSLARGILHGTWGFLRMYLIKHGFLDGKQGFLIAVLSAHSIFCKYADIWVRDQAPPNPEACDIPEAKT